MEWAAKAGVSCEMPTQTVPAVVRRVVNAVGDADSAGVGAEVVIVHSNRRAIPFGSSVFEVADQFALLTIDANDGEALTLEARP